MTIVPMARVSLCGLAADRDGALDALQTLGALHLIPLRAAAPLAPEEPAARRRADTAFAHLADCPEKLTPWPADRPFDADAVIAAILDNRATLRRRRDRLDEIEPLIEALAPWGDFRLPDPADLRGRRLWLYALPLKDRAALDRLDPPWAIVGRAPTALHVAVIAPDAPPPAALPVPPLGTGGATLAELRAERDTLVIDIETAERARADLGRWRLALGARLAAAADADDRRAAAGQTLDAGEVFAVQGWAPADAAPALRRLADDRGLALLVEPPGPGDAPPTLLRAEGDGKAMGGDLTAFYQSPSYRAWDPSVIVFVSFAIFFAMILADAGYALLMAAGVALYRRRLGGSASGRRLRALLAALAGASFAYGVAAGSYFGVAPPAGGWLARLAIVDVADFETMMRVSILVGAVHIAIALGAAAVVNRFRGEGLAAIGWLAVTAGGLLLWLAGEGPARAAAPWALAAGLGLVFAGGATAAPAGAGLGARLGGGLLGLTRATKLFGDLLSYLRLFALGLASASLAGTFNGLALEIRAAHPGVGVLLAALVLLFGHGINLAIGLMSGVVHGLRLNYIEFFGWGLPEEGYPFKAFARRETTA
jgi:V/A-type H+-transporting ATPase subunit I